MMQRTTLRVAADSQAVGGAVREISTEFLYLIATLVDSQRAPYLDKEYQGAILRARLMRSLEGNHECCKTKDH